MANIALKGRHRLYVREAQDVAYLRWINTLDTSLMEKWMLTLDTSITLEALEPAKHSVTVCNISDQHYDPRHLVLNMINAERLIREPFRIFVENDDADRHFLLTYSNKEQLKKFAELEGENLVSFEHCGGITELPKKVRNYTSKSIVNFLNCSAVFDSDAPAPGEVSREARAAKNECDRRGIFSYVLRRRAIENYLARSWLNTWVNKNPAFARSRKLNIYQAFCNLSLEQRSHFHMKRGLTADKARIDSGEISLYEGVSEVDLRTLNEGFGDSLASELYEKDWVQGSPSLDDDAWGEVNDMVREILVLCR